MADSSGGTRTPERKYVLTKIGPGDWLLPSNDQKTLWRIVRYEDGPSHGVESMDRDRDFWGLWRWLNPPHGTVDPEDWADWEMFDGGCRTRQEAIDAAMRYDARRLADVS